uniref:DNA/RNA-binding protein Alba-like domain-containing protein n=1 Tax=Craspedostauros australis TaxID=1486917 RepID=A0A7R9X0J4_9STRA|mmetsp:Transcript_4291/g.11221  ORF Transcript_4291/g.11221 Transcript_4291/m.11221 type:complete len:127 (+) Transcript_4291:1262-1642(+)
MQNMQTNERTNTQTRGSEEVILKAMGRAISKAITVAEILKRRMPLYQLNTFTTLEMIDVFEPIEEGLDIVTSTRHVACLRITLSRTGRGIDPNAVGFQPPLPFDMHGTEYYGMPPQPTQYHPSSII